MKVFRSGIQVLLLLLVLVNIMTGLDAGGQSRHCTRTYFSALIQLKPCRKAVVPFSPIPPSEACCNAVRALGQPCLCFLAYGPPISGVDYDMALQLPAKCAANFEPCAAMK